MSLLPRFSVHLFESLPSSDRDQVKPTKGAPQRLKSRPPEPFVLAIPCDPSSGIGTPSASSPAETDGGEGRGRLEQHALWSSYTAASPQRRSVLAPLSDVLWPVDPRTGTPRLLGTSGHRSAAGGAIDATRRVAPAGPTFPILIPHLPLPTFAAPIAPSLPAVTQTPIRTPQPAFKACRHVHSLNVRWGPGWGLWERFGRC